MTTTDTTTRHATAEEHAAPAGTPLDFPIQRGAQAITHVQLRKPMAGELRGIKLTELLQMDVGALQAVLPRISAPTLTPAEVAGLDPADLTELGTQVVGFFMRKSIREEFATA